MKIPLPALIALCASMGAPAFAAMQSQGSKVSIPPLILKVASKTPTQSITVRLPTQAGKVSKAIGTNLLAKGPAWLAMGDRYISLCAPNRKMVSCAPVVANEVMKGIQIGAMAGAKGEPLLTFKVDPTMTPARAAYAINYFLMRANRQVAHFNRMAVSYAPAPRQNSLTLGATSSLVTGGGGGCGFDDEGEIDCTGGSYGGGYEGKSDPIPNEPAGQCLGNCTYPSGGDNGGGDPCIAPDGSRICNSTSDIPSVPVVGQRPEEAGCRPIGPGAIECGGTPPVIGGGMEQLPKGPVPWLP